MSKSMKLAAATLVMVALAATPALAQEASQEFGQEAESGDADVSFDVTSTGDNSNQCVPANQFVNTGNLQNAQGFAQSNSTADDVEFSGSSFVFEPSLEVTCDQTIQQAAAAAAPEKKVFVPVKEKVFVPAEKKVFVPVEKNSKAVAQAGGTRAEVDGGEAVARAGDTVARADGEVVARAGDTVARVDDGEAVARAGDTVARAG